ncbi:MAG: hypothetical protein Q3999_07685 [Buchananella hordeovulneris]|nr:hypothetical protein [Buchananella hordeovulneris]
MRAVRSGLMRQVDATTCGSASLVALQALRAGHPELLGERNERAQLDMHAATSRRGLGPLPWPRALGTTPWAAAREASTASLRYRVRWLAPLVSRERGASVLAAAHRAARAGLPVPLYSGAPPALSASGVPRHVVLAVGAAAAEGNAEPGGGRNVGPLDTWRIYEPSNGAIYELTHQELLEQPGAALGGWSHLWAALLPQPRK